MFYTKYRPQKFSEISKPNDVAAALMNQVKNNKPAHAYLFIGPRGTGKTTTARVLAKALNCTKLEKNGDPCDQCDACIAIKNGSFLDLIEIDAASNRGIDDIRELRERIKLAPSSGKQKVYIIDEVHMLTTEAFNALLKTLEEPPEHATFILCTTESHKIPETIKSRCQIFNFKRATVDQIVLKLEKICKEEKAKVIKEDLEKIAQASFGGFRDAETLLQQVVEGEMDAESFIGVGTRQSYAEFVDYILEADTNSGIREINRLNEDGIDLYVWSMELVKYLRDLLFISADAYEGMIDVTDEVFSAMEEQASKFEPVEIAEIIDTFIEANNKIKSSFIAQIPLEVALVKVCGFGEISERDSVIGNDPGNKSRADSGKDEADPEEGSISFGEDVDLGLSLEAIEDKWGDILQGAVKYNNSVQALLKASKPSKLEGNKLTLEVFYKFHKERLETAKNRKIVEKVLIDIFNETMSLNCTLSKDKPQKNKPKEVGELTDYNVELPADSPVEEKILDVFDGSLPI